MTKKSQKDIIYLYESENRMILYENLDVSELLIKTHESDDFAFAELVKRYAPMINRAISSFRLGGVSFDEAFSEACVALHKAAVSYKPDFKEVTFGLYARICVERKLTDFFAKHNKDNMISDVPIENVDIGFSVGSAEAVLLLREKIQLCMSLAKEILSEYEYRVFVLYMQNYDTDAMCRELSRDKKSVENAKARMLKHLRENAELFANI